MSQLLGSKSYMTKDYVAYQENYRKNIKESDRVFLNLIEEIAIGRSSLSLVDIGCHRANLLFFLKGKFPGFRLTGIDIVPEVIELNRSDPELAGVEFRWGDILSLEEVGIADLVVCSAILFRFDDGRLRQALGNLARLLRKGGHLLFFEFVHPFRQTLRIVEETVVHPEGLAIFMRGYHSVTEYLQQAGFEEVHFRPFDIPVDLPLNDPSDPLYTHTKVTADGARLQFRGAMYQPWCHVVAKKT